MHFCSIRTCPGWPPSVDPGMEDSELFIYHDCLDDLGIECQLFSGNGKRCTIPSTNLSSSLSPTVFVRQLPRVPAIVLHTGGNKLSNLNGKSRSIPLGGEWVSPRVLAKPAEPFVNKETFLLENMSIWSVSTRFRIPPGRWKKVP